MQSDQMQTNMQAEYDRGFADAQAGEEAFPGCPVSATGRAYMRGFIAGAAAR